MSDRDLLETYLRDLRTIRLSGVALRETSSYTPLANLLNGVGAALRPKVHAIIQLSNLGAGYPDGGLFTPDQLRAAENDAPLLGQNPARGAIEVKGTGDEIADIAESDQVRRYVEHYGQVLVTNYRAFVVVTRGPNGLTETGECYALAPDEPSFWAATADPRSLAHEHGERFLEYLRRMLLLRAPLAAPKDVAFFLASYARDARSRIEGQGLPGLVPVRQALEQALGLRFEGDKGEHFFRSTLVQTLFYGVFSAWVLWSKQHPPGNGAWFSWKDTMWTLRVPAIRVLYEQVATASRLERLGLTEVLDWAEAALNRVDRAAFFARFEADHAVQYFYEPFLEAFDPQLRKELGVWYTPSEVVEYMVERVDTVLREELDIPAGLADPRVYVLDPCTGTGSYLVAVLKRIATTLRQQGGDALTGDDLKRAAMERIAGFEILPAPFVVAHLQLGLLLQNLGTPLSDKRNERAGVYLTNALTGWDAPDEPRMGFLFPELEAERDAAEHIKRDQDILVVIGNPPYNGYAGVAVAEERTLTDAYRVAKATKPPQGQGLNDLYVRFYRMAERRIVEMTGRGVISFISNYSWLDGLSFTAMRERYLAVFDQIWIDNLHGDRIISEYAPDGRTSETVFAIHGKSPGIKVGTAISLLVAREQARGRRQGVVLYRDMDQARATERTAALLESLSDEQFEQRYMRLAPVNDLGLPLKPRIVGSSYLSWPLLPDLFPVSFPGVKTSRDDVVVDIDRDRLIARMQRYFNRTRATRKCGASAPVRWRTPRNSTRRKYGIICASEASCPTRSFAMRTVHLMFAGSTWSRRLTYWTGSVRTTSRKFSMEPCG